MVEMLNLMLCVCRHSNKIVYFSSDSFYLLTVRQALSQKVDIYMLQEELGVRSSYNNMIA